MDEANPWGCISRIRAMRGFRAALMVSLKEDWSRIPGCAIYIVAEDLKDPDLIWVTEFWEDKGIRDDVLKDWSVHDRMGKTRAISVAHEFRAEIRPVLAPVTA